MDQSRRLSEQETVNRQLSAQLRSGSNNQPPAAPAQPSPSASARVGSGRGLQAPLPANPSQDEVRSLNNTLADANTAIQTLQTRIAELESQLEKVTAESKQSAAAEAELKQNLTDAGHTVESLRTEMNSQSRRLSELEAANQKLRETTSKNAQTSAQILQVASELQDVNRRRELYVSSILRRYKDLTEQYRALSASLDSRREHQAPLGTAELGGIQNTIAMSEEDLRQINALTVQASRIQKKIPQQ